MTGAVVPMASTIGDELLAMVDHVVGRTIGRLAGLSDDEFRWEPLPGAWTVRADDLDGVGVAIGAGEPAPTPTMAGWLPRSPGGRASPPST